MLLAHFGGEFHEIYVVESDRSYYDALLVGQRLYRRDLRSGDSTVLLDDGRIQAIARNYALSHPGEAPLSPDDEVSADPSTHATTETELLDVLGAFVSFEEHVDLDGADGLDEHSTRRGVIDVRNGRPVTVRDLVGDRAAGVTYAAARQHLAEAIDSVRAARDDRARRAVDLIDGFVFDSLSFTLVDDEGEPAIAFLVPGRGTRAGGYALPLEPIRIPSGPWWDSVRSTLPTRTEGALQWRGPRYRVVAREDSSGEWAVIALRGNSAGREWPVARLPAPVRRVLELDHIAADSARRRALARAFDEASLYSGEARTASRVGRRSRAPVLRAASWTHPTAPRPAAP